MIYPYIVTLKNRYRNAIDRFSILICGTSALLFLLANLRGTERQPMLLAGAIIVLVILGWNTFQLFKKKQRVRFNYLLMITGFIWLAMPVFPWISVLLVIMGLVEQQSKKDLEIGFADTIIVFNTIPRKSYGWEEFSNIVLKDNLLTLDFANNKLVQRETVDDDEEDDCEEDEFNQYCSERLKAIN